MGYGPSDPLVRRIQFPGSTSTRHRVLPAAAILAAFTTPLLADIAGDERALRQLSADIQAAAVAENLAFLVGVLHPDDVHTRPHGVVSDRAGCLSSIKRDATGPNVDYKKLTTSDVAVRVYGDTAVLTGRSGLVSKDASGPLEGEVRWTRVFLRQGVPWKLAAFQGTLVRE